jgi:hypothetical protein
MAIIFKGETQGDLSTSDYRLTTSRILHFIADDGETILDIYNAPEMPGLGAPHPANPNLKRGDLTIRKVNDGTNKVRKYEVTIPYKSPPGNTITNPGASTKEIPPWDRPLFNFSLDAVDNVVPFLKAYYIKGNPQGQPVDTFNNPSNPVVAGSGTPLGASTVESNLLIRFSYYLKEIDNKWTINYRGTINADAMEIASVPIDKYEGILRVWKPTLMREYDDQQEVKYEFYRVDVEIEIDAKKGIRTLANESTWAFDSLDGVNKRIYYNAKGIGGIKGFGSKEVLENAGGQEADINPIDETVPLSNDNGQISIDPATGKFIQTYKEFQERFPISWEPLDLPKVREARDTSELPGLS